MDNNTNNRIQRLDSNQPQSQRRPNDFAENHIFNPHDQVFVLVPENGQLAISGGVVVECYINNHGIPIYVVRRNTPGVIDYHLPRWLLFHHHEDAIFRRDAMFSPQDIDAVLQYATPHANHTMGEHLEYQLVPDYVERFDNGEIPETEMVRIGVPGAVAIGHPLYYLESVLPQSGSSCGPGKTITTKTQKKNDETNQEKCKSSEPKAKELTNRCAVVISQPRPTYNVNNRRDLDEVITDVQPDIMMRRQFDNAVEQVATLAFSRLPENSGLTYNQLYDIVHNGKQYE